VSDWHASYKTACGNRPIAFYEKVRVLPSVPHAEIRGLTGWVLGVSADDDLKLIQGYAVSFDELDEGWSVDPEHLEATGEIAPRSKFYDDDVPTLRVRVDEDGRGFIVD
jgi:hypothetical protein